MVQALILAAVKLADGDVLGNFLDPPLPEPLPDRAKGSEHLFEIPGHTPPLGRTVARPDSLP